MLPVLLNGQSPVESDTIRINEVVINGKSDNYTHSGFKVIRLDSASISDYNSRSIAELLSDNSALFVKSYGSGGIATPSFRGTGPGHTQIAWNNINLNSPMLGQFDLSLFPSGFADDVIVSYGGASMDLNSGGIGGIINIETKPDWNQENVLFINPRFGSFNRYSGLARVRTGSPRFQSVTKAFLSSAENNFLYLNNIRSQVPVWEKRQNSQVSQEGFIQELYFRGSKGTLSTRFWYQTTSRNLPVPLTMFSSGQGEKQDDRSLRGLVSYETLKEKSKYSMTAAFLSDRLNYFNRLASINSENLSRSVVMRADMISHVADMSIFKLYLNNELNFINSNNYQGKRSRNIASAGASVETRLTKWFGTKVLVREILQDSKLLVPDFSIGAEFRLIPVREYFIKTNFSKNSKVPTLNDMYWLPGGNPDLKNETGYTAELGMATEESFSPSLKFKGELTVFRSSVTDMIQWLPGENTYWEAGNVNKITINGLESNINMAYSLARFKALVNLIYTFTQAASHRIISGNELSPKKQLMYIPKNKLNSVMRLSWKSLHSSLNANYISRRYLTADNSQYLPGYTVTDINFGVKLNLKNTIYDITLMVENLFNTSYQDIAWYPMPGRAWSLSVVFQLKK